MAEVIVLCVHCGKGRRAKRPRGLCWGCYNTPGVRHLYPCRPANGGWVRPDHMPTKREVHKPSKPASEPLPEGHSWEERLAVMAERREQNESLFHPGDAECEVVPLRWLREKMTTLATLMTKRNL